MIKKLNKNTTHFLSVDLEDWHTSAYLREYVNKANLEYRIEYTTNKIIELFDGKNVKATFFALGSIAQKYPKLIKLIKENNHEIASHGYSHTPLWNLNKETFREELVKTNCILESITGEKVIGFRAPYASLNQNTAWALDVLEDLGFKYDSSIFPMKTPLYGVKDAPNYIYKISSSDIKTHNSSAIITEIPFTIYKKNFLKIPCTGGIYGRFLPLPILNSLLKKIAKSRPINFYFHPWEIDLLQKKIKTPLYNHIVSYYGINTYYKKITNVLEEFNFTSFREKLITENLIKID